MSRFIPLVLAAACWGLGTVASKRAVTELPPTLLLVIQLGSSVAVLTLVWLASAGRRRPPVRLGLLGVLNPGLAYLLSLMGLASITAGLSVLLWSLEPVLIVALAWLVLGDRLSPRAIAWSLLAVAGAALAGSQGIEGGQLRGIALTVAAVACCAIYTVAASSWMRAESSLAVVVVQQWFALVFACLVVLFSGGVALSGASATAWISAVGSGVMYYGLAFWAFLVGLQRVKASTAAASINLVPLFGIGAGYVFLGERMQPLQLVGAAIAILAVVALVSRGSVRDQNDPRLQVHRG
jgi:probable blue pigment (indigoidine) exporter